MISKEEKNDVIDKMKDIKFHNNNQHTKKIMGLLGINNNNINNNSNNIAKIPKTFNNSMNNPLPENRFLTNSPSDIFFPLIFLILMLIIINTSILINLISLKCKNVQNKNVILLI